MKKLLSQIILIAFTAQTVLAANKDVYIVTTGSNGSGSIGSPYNTCANMVTGEVAANADLTTLGGHIIVHASGSTADGPCTITGFTGVDATHLMKYYGNRTLTSWDTSKYRITAPDSNGVFGLVIAIPNFELYDTQVETLGTGSGSYAGLASTTGSKEILVAGNIFRSAACNGGGGGSCWPAIWQPDVDNTRNYFINNIFLGAQTNSISPALRLYGSVNHNGEISVVYHNTFIGGQYGLATHGGGNSDAQYIKDNVAINQLTAAYGLSLSSGFTTTSTANNISFDISSPDAAYRSKTCSLVSTTFGSEDGALQSGDTNCKNAGISLVTDSDGKQNVTVDIVGTTRPQGASVDIGAFEYTSTASGTKFQTLQLLGIM